MFEYFDFKKEILALEKAGLLREIVKAFYKQQAAHNTSDIF